MPSIKIIKNTVIMPRDLGLEKRHYQFMIQTIERDIHRRIKRGVDLRDKPQKRNKPGTTESKRRRGLPLTPLMEGWRPYGYHRFTSRFRRDFGKGWAVLALHKSPAPGGFAGQAKVAGYVSAMGYRVPFGISEHSQKIITAFVATQLQKKIERQVKKRKRI